ncbi:RNA polymerase sigma factor [Amycolatopsis regifaucium]|uniref:RNA polymerase sigma factor 70 region 4 type 2 domain-containing protein n=1 Tax=Amycolatopsis regifaucium TaxID=546365 RepID=A0ABX3DL32_9PSEU|nr:hypothetical protein ATP06_0227290 [Amycolatopsis regifaucium]
MRRFGLDRFPEHLREVLGYSYAEIAAETGISESTARVHANHARASLRRTVLQPSEVWIVYGGNATASRDLHVGNCVYRDRRRRAFSLRRLLSARAMAASLSLFSVLVFLV